MTYDTITTLSGERVLLDMIVGNFHHVLVSAHGMDDFVLDLLVRAARHTPQSATDIAAGIVGYFPHTADLKDCSKLLEAFVLSLRQQRRP